MRIGFIGAGLMGHGMALNLLKGGHQVQVIAHRNRAPIEDLLAKGLMKPAVWWKSLRTVTASFFVFPRQKLWKRRSRG